MLWKCLNVLVHAVKQSHRKSAWTLFYQKTEINQLLVLNGSHKEAHCEWPDIDGVDRQRCLVRIVLVKSTRAELRIVWEKEEKTGVASNSLMGAFHNIWECVFLCWRRNTCPSLIDLLLSVCVWFSPPRAYVSCNDFFIHLNWLDHILYTDCCACMRVRLNKWPAACQLCAH